MNLIRRNCNLRADKVDNNKYKCESHWVKFCKIINHLYGKLRIISTNVNHMGQNCNLGVHKVYGYKWTSLLLGCTIGKINEIDPNLLIF